MNKFLLCTVIPVVLLFLIVQLIKWSQVNILPQDFRLPRTSKSQKFKLPTLKRREQGGWDEVDTESSSDDESSSSSFDDSSDDYSYDFPSSNRGLYG